MTDTAAETASVPAPLWRRVLRSPAAWGAVLVVGAYLLTVATSDLDVLPFLLMLVGGWCLGFAFVNLTVRMPRHGVAVHIAGAILVAAVVVLLTGVDDLNLPERAAAVTAVVVIRLAAIPAAAWIWLALLGRVTTAVTRRERRTASVRAAPQWERDEGGDGSLVRLPAIELRMRDLVVAIVGVVLIVAAATVALMVAIDDVVTHLGARLSVVVIGLVIGLPAYVAVTALLRRRTAQCTIAFGNDEVRIHIGDTAHVIRFVELEHLRWRPRSDYARVEARGGGADVSLFAGLATPEAGKTAELPDLPRRVHRRLELAGLEAETSRRGEVVTFRRAR